MAQSERDATSSDEPSSRTPLDALEERLPSGADVHVNSDADWVLIDPDPSADHEDASTIILESDGDAYSDGFTIERYNGRPSVSSTAPDERAQLPTPVAAFKKAAEFATSDDES